MSRRNARECLYKLVFEFSFLKEKNNDTLDFMLLDASLTEDDKQYLTTAYDGIVQNYDALVQYVGENAEGYALDRIYRPDLIAMIISVYEMQNLPTIPPAVSISEAVELVKRYSGAKSNQFVNGVLATVYKKLFG